MDDNQVADDGHTPDDGQILNDKAPEDLMDILVATDIHLGYEEKDPERGDDSFISFEEILKIAQARGVDLMLLGGDLFHDSKPSAQCIHRCLKLLRQYCLGDRPIRVEFLSDQSENFRHCDFPVVNYEDPNYSISLPVFSIHGNHDDPSGYGRMSTLDIMSVTNLVNYFGKWTDLKNVEVSPLLLRKGKTKVAVYGLSHIKDDRLARLFRDQNVKFYQPQWEAESWFNIFMCHQNRAQRGVLKYLPEEAIPPFIDFVIWGHEHESRIRLEFNEVGRFHVTQPGSPVATSLCEGESKPKHVGLLQVYHPEGAKAPKSRFFPIKLRSVRPFVFDTVVLSEENLDDRIGTVNENVEAFLKDKVEEMIEIAQEQITGYDKQPTLPLIRLRVEWSDEEQLLNPMRFGQVYYQGSVANPDNILLFRKEKTNRKVKEEAIDKDVIEGILDEEIEDVQSVVERYFTEVDPSKQLKVLSLKGLGEAVSRFVDKKDRTAVIDLTNHQINKTVKFMKERDDVNEENLLEMLEEYRLARLARAQEEMKEAQDMLDGEDRTVENFKMESDHEENGNDLDVNGDDQPHIIVTLPTRGRGSRGRGRAKAEVPASTGRGRGRGRGSRGGATTPRAAARGIPKLTLTRSPPMRSPVKSPVRSSSRTPSTRMSNRARITYDEFSDSD
nr:PREDICTED: double-strand break repair protein MRE11 [Bemisia tabaci]